MLAFPKGVALDGEGNLFIAEGGVRTRRVDAATGVITTVASDEAVKTTEGGRIQVVTTTIGELVAVVVNDQGQVFLADYNKNVVHKVSAPPAP